MCFFIRTALGAKAAIFVEFAKRDENYRFFIQMYDTETEKINGMLALPVELDGLLADFTGETYISPEKRREMEKDEELARVKKELEELKSKHTASDTKSRLESEMAQRQTSPAQKKRIVRAK